jgi:hypothetical protein
MSRRKEHRIIVDKGSTKYCVRLSVPVASIERLGGKKLNARFRISHTARSSQNNTNPAVSLGTLLGLLNYRHRLCLVVYRVPIILLVLPP